MRGDGYGYPSIRAALDAGVIRLAETMFPARLPVWFILIGRDGRQLAGGDFHFVCRQARKRGLIVSRPLAMTLAEQGMGA